MPAINIAQLQPHLMAATRNLGRLDAISTILPDKSLLLYYYIRKEAVLSSQIEGTQSSLSDLLLYESDEMQSTPIKDVVEVSSYVAALEHGVKRLEEGFPISLRVICEIHKILLSKGRGSSQRPGEFRRTQNWIGGTRPGNAAFVPPPPDHLMKCLGDLENYLHIRKPIYPALIDAGLVHVQFETIHPFLDGNGRVGRLLIPILIILSGELAQPVIYLSLFFKNNRNEYYTRLDAVRTKGDWEGWLKFFLNGIAQTADQIIKTSTHISALLVADREKITTLKRAAQSASKAHQLLQQKGVISAKEIASKLDISLPTARLALNNLKNLKIVKEIKGRGKERLFVYEELIELLEKGTEPIAY